MMDIQSRMIELPSNGHGATGCLVLILVVSLGLAACGPDTPTLTPAETDTPIEQPTDEATEAPVEEGVTDAATDEPEVDAALPDLVFSGFSIEMEGHTPGQCVEAYGAVTTTVCIRNQGESDAGEFAVSGGLPEWSVEELSAGEEVCHVYTSSPGEVVIDPEDEVAESDEDNNTTFIPVATPPALCTPVGEGGSGGSGSAAATEEPTESTDAVVDALCAANGGVQWTGMICVCPGVVDVVTICGDGFQLDSVTDQACVLDIACDGTGSGGGGSDNGGGNPPPPPPPPGGGND